jgi:multiple sugar transport system permease protein
MRKTAVREAKKQPDLQRLAGKYASHVRDYVLGREANQGLLFKLFIYTICICTAYVYVNPILYMATTMVKNLSDLLDPTVTWVPKSIYVHHLLEAFEGLKYYKTFFYSLGISTVSALFQVATCAITGYAIARLKIPFKKFWYACLIITFIVPPQVTVLPTIIAFNELGLANNLWVLLIPTLFGHGVKGVLFVFIFRQFFASQPKELEEACKMDGAGIFKTFYRVMMPLAKPAILVVFLFSFVWNWNDYYYPSMFLTGAKEVPLSMAIAQFNSSLTYTEGQGAAIFLEPIKMSASFLVIVPPLILYLFTQRWFVESVERTGLVE